MSNSSLFQNNFIVDELSYNKEDMGRQHSSLLQDLNCDQLKVYKEIMSAVLLQEGGFFFVYGYGGTVKTFIWRTFSCALRSKGMLVLNVASSGIASLLLPGGKTAHSRFCIPILINE